MLSHKLPVVNFENETFFPFFPFETSMKADEILKCYYTRNLHNFVYEVNDALHGTFHFRVKTDKLNYFLIKLFLN